MPSPALLVAVVPLIVVIAVLSSWRWLSGARARAARASLSAPIAASELEAMVGQDVTLEGELHDTPSVVSFHPAPGARGLPRTVGGEAVRKFHPSPRSAAATSGPTTAPA